MAGTFHRLLASRVPDRNITVLEQPLDKIDDENGVIDPTDQRERSTRFRLCSVFSKATNGFGSDFNHDEDHYNDGDEYDHDGDDEDDTL